MASVNDEDPVVIAARKSFEEMTPIFPNERIELDGDGAPIPIRMIKNYNTTNGLDENSIYSIFKDSQGQIWTGSMNGICQYDAQKQHFTPIKHLEALIIEIVEDAKGNLCIGTSQGLFSYNGQTKQIKSFTSANSQLPEGNVYEVSFDSTGKGWIATETGMCIYDPASQSLRSNVFPEGFVNKDKVRTIYEDAEHNLYFIREKGSLFTSTLTMDRFQNRSIFSTLPDNSLMSVIEDNQGWLWVACNDGLLRIKEEGEEYDAFTFNDGVPGPTFTNGAAYKDEKGLLWFGNTKGLIYVDPKRVDEVRGKVRSIVFTDILANGVPFTSSSLKYNQNNLTFCFTDFAYGLPSALLYEYRLEGVDKDWKLLAAQNEVSYYGLSSGTYTFRVRLPGNEQSEASCQVTVCPMIPWWGWGLSVLLIVGIIAFIRYYVWKRMRRLLVSSASPVVVSSAEEEIQQRE